MKKVLKKLIVICMCLFLCTGCDLKEIIKDLLAATSSSSQQIGGSNEGCEIYTNLDVLYEEEGVSLLSTKSELESMIETMNESTFMSTACYIVNGVRYERVSSGFIVRKEQLEEAYKYYLVTNASKLFYRAVQKDGGMIISREPKYVEVVFGNYKRYYAEVEAYSDKKDIVILSIVTKDELNVVTLGDSDSLILGDAVYSMGTPELGVSLINSVIKGNISNLNVSSTISLNNEAITSYTTHQFDAPINSGMEGGPVFVETGEVVGVLTYKYGAGNYESLSRFIPINDVKNCIDSLIENKEYAPPLVGISVLDLYTAVSIYGVTWPDEIGVYEGCYVESVSSGSASAKSGMLGDSIIVGIYLNEQYIKVKDSNIISVILARYKEGDTLKFEVQYKTEKKVHVIFGD